MGEHELKMQYGEGETRNIPRKIARSWLQNEERREKSGLRRAKNERYPSKNRPKTDLKREKREKRRFWSEKGGAGEGRKNELYC